MYIKIQSGILTFSIITLNKAQCRYLGEIMAEMITLYSQQRSGREEREGWWFTITVMKMTSSCPGRPILMQDHEEGNHNIIANTPDDGPWLVRPGSDGHLCSGLH